MFTDEELKDYAEQLNQLGITDEKQQKKVLEFFYTLGKITYNFGIGYDEEESYSQQVYELENIIEQIRDLVM